MACQHACSWTSYQGKIELHSRNPTIISISLNAFNILQRRLYLNTCLLITLFTTLNLFSVSTSVVFSDRLKCIKKKIKQNKSFNGQGGSKFPRLNKCSTHDYLTILRKLIAFFLNCRTVHLKEIKSACRNMMKNR